MRLTLESILQRDRNNFDLIRVVAAAAVILGHSFSLHPTGGWQDPIGKVFEFTYSGSVAVDIFFFLSGIFVAASFCQSRSLLRFALMRAARILPGLAICLVITALLVGAVVTSKSATEYFASGDVGRYIIKNIQLQKLLNRLPGVFEFNHYRLSVNGSLWTLPVEVRCYAMVFIFGVLGGFKHVRWSVALALALAAFAVFYPDALKIFRVSEDLKLRLPLIFSLGIMFYVNRGQIRIDWRLSVVALLVALLFRSTAFGVFAAYAFLFNTVLVIGSAQFLRRLKLKGDYSFGIYIYGWVIQQCVANYLPELESYPSLLLTLPLSIAAGALSWHLIEAPSLRFARSVSDRYEAKRGVSVHSA